MIAKHNHWCAALVAVVVVAGTAIDAFASCSSCGVPATYSASYAAPVAYTSAYAPAYTTYNSGWYPGYYMDRIRANWWGARTYTAAYPVTHTAGYATTAYYAPTHTYASYSSGCSSCAAPACSTCTAGYAPTCSSCSTCTSCATPACGNCSACTVSYAPACSGCATGCPSCAGTATVSQVSYTEAAPCTNCAPAATSTTTTIVSPPTTSTYLDQSTSKAPELAPSANPAPERFQETQKPATNDTIPIQPEPQADPAEESAIFEAPHLLNPNDQTAQQRHQAPVLNAVYHKPAATTPSKVQTVSFRQAQLDSEGWVSASE